MLDKKIESVRVQIKRLQELLHVLVDLRDYAQSVPKADGLVCPILERDVKRAAT